MFSRFFICEEVIGMRDKRSGFTRTVDMQRVLDASLNMSLTSVCFSDEASSGKFQVSGYSPHKQGYQDFWIIRHWIKGVLLCLENMHNLLQQNFHPS